MNKVKYVCTPLFTLIAADEKRLAALKGLQAEKITGQLWKEHAEMFEDWSATNPVAGDVLILNDQLTGKRLAIVRESEQLEIIQQRRQA